MINDWASLAELDRQRRAQIASSIAAARRHPRQRRARWWEREFLPRPNPMTHPLTATASRVAATA
jgi:hypothetical protein